MIETWYRLGVPPSAVNEDRVPFDAAFARHCIALGGTFTAIGSDRGLLTGGDGV